MCVTAVASVVYAFVAEWFNHTHPIFYPLVPYWILITAALSLSPVTCILPGLLKGDISWPKKKDVPDVWTIHGKRYDLRPFMKQHPGGSFMLRAARGTDATGVFESYHVFIDREVLLKMLAQFEIKDADAPNEQDADTPIQQQDIRSDPFYEDVKQMVRDHFRGKPKGSHKMTWPHLAICALAWLTRWALMVKMVTQDCKWCIPVIAFLAWYIFGIVQHDTSHFAFVKQPGLNRVLSYSAFPYGVSTVCWHIQHVLSHHIHTNAEQDVDLYHFDPVMVMQKGVNSVNIFLHYTRVFIITSTTMLHESMVIPYMLIVGHRDALNGHKMFDRIKAIESHRAELRVEMIIEVVCMLAYFLLVFSVQGVIKGLCYQLSVFALTGYLFIFFTQVSHLQEECFMDEKDRDKLSFAKQQVTASMDFATDSTLWSHVSGGLNMQALHHILPAVSAMHLQELYPKFRQICRKHDVQLKEATSLSTFLRGCLTLSN